MHLNTKYKSLEGCFPKYPILLHMSGLKRREMIAPDLLRKWQEELEKANKEVDAWSSINQADWNTLI